MDAFSASAKKGGLSSPPGEKFNLLHVNDVADFSMASRL